MTTKRKPTRKQTDKAPQKKRLKDFLDGSGALSSTMTPRHAPFVRPKKASQLEIDKERQLQDADHQNLGLGQYRKVPVRYE